MTVSLSADIRAPRSPSSPSRRWLQTRLMLAASLVILADLLFYGRTLGISLGCFLAALAAVSLWANPVRASAGRCLVAFLVLGAGLLAVAEEVSLLSSLVAVLCIAVFAVMLSRQNQARWQDYLREARRMLFAGAFRLAGDIARVGRLSARGKRTSSGIGGLAGWVVPLSLLGVFAALFASENPLVEIWLNRIDPRSLFGLLSPRRGLFWL